MRTNILDGVDLTLPRYLSARDRAEMSEQLKLFPAPEFSYYGAGNPAGTWQGDTFERLKAMRLVNDAPSFVRNSFLVISNTCDICEDNKRDRQIHITVAPITTVAKFRDLLLDGGSTADKVNSILTSIRRQENTSIFYLPSNGDLREESIAFLDAIQSLPVEHFRGDEEKRRVTSMSNAGWYLLLVKLALHFCRAMEGESREAFADADDSSGAVEARVRVLPG